MEAHSHQKARGSPETVSFAARLTLATDILQPPMCKCPYRVPQLTHGDVPPAIQLTISVNRP
ncbi:hypothetical protein GCM10009544_11800 [Streptomyces stramineus]|uniref:Uncharacterized protein n=1 Tax=Streptomyces stramineus TaxID=173861 RepID=A0ABP3JDV7_9ACTN